MQFETLMKKPTYKAIIRLLLKFQKKKLYKNGEWVFGLEQKHFRFALEKHPKLNQMTIDDMEKFFGNEKIQDKNKIFNSKSHLDKCIQKLISYGYVTELNKKVPKRYYLLDEFWLEYLKQLIKDEINNSKKANILSLNEIEFFYGNNIRSIFVTVPKNSMIKDLLGG